MTDEPVELGDPVEGVDPVESAELEAAVAEGDDDAAAGIDELARSGFATLVGRPNVGKSTLLNAIVGMKVSITSKTPQTTRHEIRGVLHDADSQIVFVDTPGVHKPRSAMGERLNRTATESFSGVDTVCLVLDARGRIGTGDRYIAQQLPADAVVIVNKCDGMGRERVFQQLEAASAMADECGLTEAQFFAVSAQTRQGLDDLVNHLRSRMPPGPRWYPEGQTHDLGDGFRAAELVREQLLRLAREELPHSIATRCLLFEPPLVQVEILVERESQKPIVIGKGGSVLKQVGIAARRKMPPGVYLELTVRVSKDWQRSDRVLDDLGY